MLKAVLVAETAGLGEFFGAAVAGTVTAEHQIFGRVGEVDELDDVDVVAFVLQDRCADGVGQQRREALLKQPVGEQNVEIAALLDGLVDLVLAAGDGEDVLDAAGDGVVQGVVGRDVAGMERDKHVNVLIVEHIARHVGNDKAQTIVAVARGDLIAVLDDILF